MITETTTAHQPGGPVTDRETEVYASVRKMAGTAKSYLPFRKQTGSAEADMNLVVTHPSMSRRWTDIVFPQNEDDGFAQRAARFGADELIYARTPENTGVTGPDAEDITAHDAVVLSPGNPGELKDGVTKYRHDVAFVAVMGNDPAVNREAFEDPRVDAVFAPDAGRNDAGVDHVMMKMAAEHGVAIGISIARLFDTTGKDRAHLITHMREQIRLAQKFDAPIMIGSGATRPDQIRAPRDMAAFGSLWGMVPQAALDAVSNAFSDPVDNAAAVQSGEQVRPGVRKVDDDE